ncbi:MAG: SDR family oxidoreductase [Myxococcota bacterium]|nr:SDR family oxidoreductase [Myxococcota bacterium]
MSKILTIGANGQIGRLFCEKAMDAELPIRAMVRSDEQRARFEAQGVEAVVGDVEGDFFHAFDGCDQVVFTAGSGGSTGGDKTLLVDLYGAIRAIAESEARGVKHFVMVSALRAEQPLKAVPAMRHYMVAKLLADQRLIESNVAATVLRPGRLTDEVGSGRVRTSAAAGDGFDISRENVASCIREALRQPSRSNRVVDLLDGDTLIRDVFAKS